MSEKLVPVLWLMLASIIIGTSIGFAARADADIYFTVCPSGRAGVATPDTSCAFADSVRQAWYSQPGRTIFAHSPVTGQMYTMQCDSTYTTVWVEAKRCYGLNSSGAPLVVYVD
ncbi:MAG: hypothetical protein ACPGXI_10980 [Mycobacterium sp.]